ncbi:sensor histidine kinase [Bacteroidota bacterium]
MNKKIKIVTILMSIALLGIIGFQIFWISNFYKQNLERFEKDVNYILYTSLNKEKLHRIKSFREGSGSIAVISGSYNSGIIKNINNDSTEISVSTNSANPNKLENYNQRIIIDQANVSSEFRFDIKSDESFNYIIEEVFTLQPSISRQINYHDLDSIYKKELKMRDIDIPFIMGIWNPMIQSFIYLNDENPNLEKLTKGIIGNINTGDFLNQHVLMNYFPSKSKYMVKKLGGVFFASLLMILITLGSFVFALSTIISQRRLSEIKNDFINNMTHELKTPISTVSLAIEALQNFDVLKDKKRTRQYLDISKNENARLGMMVEKVLKISAFEKKEIKLNFEKTDIHHLIHTITENVEVQINNKGGILNLDLSAGNYYIEADQVHITNVIYNLVDNAIKYSLTEPEITVFTKDADNSIMIAVQDRGIGIASQQQKRIFDKFYRVPTGNVHNVKGYGLGLSYVADIIKKHNGSIKLESEPKKGSLFKIFIPLSRPELKNGKLN